MGLEGKHAGANAIYFAAATNADRHIGRLLDHLDETDMADNTTVSFSADNGPEDIAVRNAAHSGVGSPGPFRGRKRSLYEGGIRTPSSYDGLMAAPCEHGQQQQRGFCRRSASNILRGRRM
jgi:arylsulfatase A-like enzyme